MGVLNQSSRQELLALLTRLPVLATRPGRDLLLRDLPDDLVRGIERSEATVVDLDHIVYAADSWWPTDGTVAAYPLRLLVQTASDLAAGSEAAPALQAFLTALPPTLDPRARPRCPYPGMVPFSPEDSRFFYGREGEIAEMLRRLRVGRYLLVVGPSGSGKSSLVTAGLLPALARQQPDTWHTVTLRPGAIPTTALARALGGDPAQPAVAVQALLTARVPTTRLLVIVDQFEELFTLADRPGQSAFLTALTALRAVPPATLVLLMRADFYPELMQSVLWPPGEGERLEIAPLHGDPLRAAITQPAADLGVTVEPDLVERLVADSADEPGSLPLLQEALVLLWQQVRGRTLRLADYAALGQGERSGLAVALATRADGTYNTLTAAQQGVARRIFLRLIAFGEGRPDTRRQQSETALQVPGEERALFAATLAALTDHRLLTTTGAEQAAGARRVDLAHEVLIGGWPLLQHWITARRTAEQTRRRLEAQAEAWVRLGRGRGGLLDEAELPEAQRWLAGPDAAELGYSGDLRTLVQASAQALSTAAQEKEAARQHELAQAQALAAEQQQRAEAERQKRRRTQVLAGVLFLIALAGSYVLLKPYALAWMAAGPTVRIAGGQAAIGSSHPPADTDEGPVWSTPVATFSMEVYEVANRQYRLCVEAAVCSEPLNARSYYEEGADALPVIVTAYQAAAYCRWIGRTLPTEIQWEWAAQGQEDRPWPWTTPLPHPDQGCDDPDNKAFLQQRMNVYWTSPEPAVQDVEAYAAGQTPEGVYNLAGNVMEWTASAYAPYNQAQREWNGDRKTGPAKLVLRGGSVQFGCQQARPTARFGAAPTGENFTSSGVRCVTTP